MHTFLGRVLRERALDAGIDPRFRIADEITAELLLDSAMHDAVAEVEGDEREALVDVAGGENIFNDTKRAYLEASKETVVLRAPEVILEYHAWQELAAGELERFRDDWKELPMLPAVENGRVYTEVDTYALRPGPRVALTARKMAKIFHPTVVFPDP